MTMELIGSRGQVQHFTLPAWKQLTDLALMYGWKPAGALEPEPDDESADPEDFIEDDVNHLPDGLPEPKELQEDHPVAQAIRSLFPGSDDPVLSSYFQNGGFRVTAADAQRLAEALERALPDLSEQDALHDKACTIPSEPGVKFIRLDTPVNAFEWFSGQNKAHLRQFIAFCRQGGFEIR